MPAYHQRVAERNECFEREMDRVARERVATRAIIAELPRRAACGFSEVRTALGRPRPCAPAGPYSCLLRRR
eukprot:63867-Prymnesium_polylepis.1